MAFGGNIFEPDIPVEVIEEAEKRATGDSTEKTRAEGAENVLTAYGRGIVPQILKAEGAVTINAKEAAIETILLEANATSSAITNPKAGQLLTIEWIQDAVGKRTYKWPANCKFAGGTAPAASEEKGYIDSVTFRYIDTSTAWFEISRSVSVR